MPLSKSLKLLAKRPDFWQLMKNGEINSVLYPLFVLVMYMMGKLGMQCHTLWPLLNADWFWPFSHFNISLEQCTSQFWTYPEIFAVNNNVILVGMMPVPSEPKLSMNSYLSPLVEELKQGWDEGFTVTTYEGVQVALGIAQTCVACDILTSRKVCGCIGH